MKRYLSGRTLRVLIVGVTASALLSMGLTSGISAASPAKHKAPTTVVKKTTTAVANATTPIVLTSPAIPNVAPLPGPIEPTPTLPATPLSLSVTPATGIIGTPITVTGANLPDNSTLQIYWSTWNATWKVGADPSTVNYLGSQDTPIVVLIGSVTTNSSGAFTLNYAAPQDFGGTHALYVVANGVALAEGSFTTLRTVTMTPTSGPIGTPITITYSGLGASQYTGGASLLWDNHYVGEMMADWTRGVATASIRATGPIGDHTIQIGNAISYLYLNVPQSPIPYTNGATQTFDTTADNGPPLATIDAPDAVQPTLKQITTLDEGGLGTAKSSVQTTSSLSSGTEGTNVTVAATDLASNAPVSLQWATVVGNRVNCASTCWAFSTSNLTTSTPTSDAFSTGISIPSPTLGGWHAIQVVQNNVVVGQIPFYVKESIVGYQTGENTAPTTALTVTEGQQFSIHIEGIGWTQLDNTVAVDYDNSYVGYGCGFNSNGDVVLNLTATGAPGTHIIDLYPMLYSLSPSFANAPYGMVPLLTYAADDPALALGYQLGAFRFAITVVAP